MSCLLRKREEMTRVLTFKQPQSISGERHSSLWILQHTIILITTQLSPIHLSIPNILISEYWILINTSVKSLGKSLYMVSQNEQQNVLKLWQHLDITSISYQMKDLFLINFLHVNNFKENFNFFYESAPNILEVNHHFF